MNFRNFLFALQDKKISTTCSILHLWKKITVSLQRRNNECYTILAANFWIQSRVALQNAGLSQCGFFKEWSGFRAVCDLSKLREHSTYTSHVLMSDWIACASACDRALMIKPHSCSSVHAPLPNWKQVGHILPAWGALGRCFCMHPLCDKDGRLNSSLLHSVHPQPSHTFISPQNVQCAEWCYTFIV